MNIKSSPRSKHPEDFLDHSPGLIDMVEDAVGVDIVEAGRWKRDGRGVALAYFRAACQPLTSQTKMFRSNIDTERLRPVLGELQQIAARAATNFQNTLTPMVPELRYLIQPGIYPVPFFLRQQQRSLVPVFHR
jgi:hypothetical protein